MTDFNEIELGKMDDVQLEHLGRSLKPPYEVDRRHSLSKIVRSLEKHVKDTDAKVSDDWTGDVPSKAQTGADGPGEPDAPASEDPDRRKPSESKFPVEGAEAVLPDLAARTAELDEQAAEAEKRETAIREREEAVSKREDAAVAHTSDGGTPGPVGRTVDLPASKPGKFSLIGELRDLEEMTIVPPPRQLYMQPSERKFRERLHTKIQALVKRVAKR